MKYTFTPEGIDKYTDAVNESAYKLIDRKNLQYDYPVEPVYPLKWYLCFGKAPKEFIERLLTIRPSAIAQVIMDNVDENCMDIIKAIEAIMK